ncbi:MAG: glycosyltransferase family 2 protein [Chloroflexota bacterium]|nr:glycosyltransferase family 2 protein [Chloroflexota bacterium]
MTAELRDTTVIVPARDEAGSIGDVIDGLRALGVRHVIVVDDASRDGTARVARAAGAEVVRSAGRGYGWACHTGVAAANGALIVAFIDGDGSFDPRDLAELVTLIRSGADLAVGTRSQRSAMPLHQNVGNAVTLALLRALYGVSLRDIAPLRAITGEALTRLEMRPTRYAWLVEMLAKASRCDLRIATRPVHYGRRIAGTSKVSGSARGSLLAGLDFVGALIAYRRW